MAIKSFRLGKDNWARTRPTKEGMMFLGLTFFVGFAAINTGNNLIYMIFGMMLSFIASSGIISMINLAGIEVKPLYPREAYAHSPAPIRFSLTNLKFLIPSYSLTININGKKGFLTHLPPKLTKNVTVNFVFDKRGWNTVPEAQMYTKFPFGFFMKWIKLDLGEEQMLVYPKLVNESVYIDEYLSATGEVKADRLGPGTDIRSLRDYAYGDNPKHIHWKVSAKAGKLILREMEDEDSQKVLLEFKPGTKKRDLESEISRSASIFLKLLKMNYKVEFIAPTRVFNAHETSVSYRPVLTYLALYS